MQLGRFSSLFFLLLRILGILTAGFSAILPANLSCKIIGLVSSDSESRLQARQKTPKIFTPKSHVQNRRCSSNLQMHDKIEFFHADDLLIAILVAQCSATPATVAATPPCSATPFQTQISVRHLPAHGGGGATPQFLGV